MFVVVGSLFGLFTRSDRSVLNEATDKSSGQEFDSKRGPALTNNSYASLVVSKLP